MLRVLVDQVVILDDLVDGVEELVLGDRAGDVVKVGLVITGFGNFHLQVVGTWEQVYRTGSDFVGLTWNLSVDG